MYCPLPNPCWKKIAPPPCRGQIGLSKNIAVQHTPPNVYFASYIGKHISYFSKIRKWKFSVWWCCCWLGRVILVATEANSWCSPLLARCARLQDQRWRCSIIAFHWIALHSVAVSSYCNTLAFLMGRNMALVIRMLFLCKRSFLSLKRPGQSHYLKEQTISFRYFELWDYLYTSW